METDATVTPPINRDEILEIDEDNRTENNDSATIPLIKREEVEEEIDVGNAANGDQRLGARSRFLLRCGDEFRLRKPW
ncbi:hypothetical protein L195_g042500 [Trifolium pratense]|uniref:Uncharacterized protein n=1 Tax=Trifolium pratense TaxID=57577 RepID=A0A2K3M6J8_TRIPR|nr:hypothetical protein L195_g042500 [Trifolium pratense]